MTHIWGPEYGSTCSPGGIPGSLIAASSMAAPYDRILPAVMSFCPSFEDFEVRPPPRGHSQPYSRCSRSLRYVLSSSPVRPGGCLSSPPDSTSSRNLLYSVSHASLGNRLDRVCSTWCCTGLGLPSGSAADVSATEPHIRPCSLDRRQHERSFRKLSESERESVRHETRLCHGCGAAAR